jgi:hypothetical protein
MAAGWGEKFQTYLILETTWWVSWYAICYRFRPTVRLMQTELGSRAVHRAGRWLQRMWPSRYQNIAAASARAYESPNGRTFGEWLLINKVLSPVSFPLKVAMANRIVNQRQLAHVPSNSSYLASIASPTADSDLEPVKSEVVRRLTSGLASRSAVTMTMPAREPRPSQEQHGIQDGVPRLISPRAGPAAPISTGRFSDARP